MPLEIRTRRDGTLRPVWYGRFKIKSKRHCQSLGVKLRGTPPPSLSLREEGDVAFERSRATAQAKLDQVIEQAHDKRNAARWVEKLHEIQTGERIQSVALSGLADDWAKLPRRRKPSPRYILHGRSTLERFAGYVQAHDRDTTDLSHVTRRTAQLFLEAEDARGITAKTWNDTLKLLRSAFKHLLPEGSINPLSNVPTRETDTVFRQPYTAEELGRIVAAAKDDDFVRPIIITAMCTAMRRGDCCQLKWKDVDLEKGFISVKTGKTRQTVDIPVFPMLQEELVKKAEDRSQKAEGEFVFPEQAKMYGTNPDGITWRVQKILATALGNADHLVTKLPAVPAAEARKRGLDYIAGLPESAKRERMRTVFEHYMDGMNTKQLVGACGISKGTASNYLNQIELAAGCRIVRGRPSEISPMARIRNEVGLLRAKRKDGQRAASVRDFHSFRVTWVTVALIGGVPLEVVRKVTGHQTADIVLRHYFKPGREAMRQALQTAMPNLLTDGSKSPNDEMREILDSMTVKTWRKDRDRLLDLMAAASG